VPRRLTAREIAVGGIMAAVMAVAAFIPVTVVAGVGKVISAAVMLEPLIGIILGPVLGTYAAAFGSIAGLTLAPQGAIFGPLTFIPPTVGAASAGLLAHKKWKTACGVMGVVLLLWYSTSIGRELYYYPYVPLIFLGLAILFRHHLGEWIHVKYDEIVGFKKAGLRILIIGAGMVAVSQVLLVVYVGNGITVGIAGCMLAVLVLLSSVIKSSIILRKVSGILFIGTGILILLGFIGLKEGMGSTFDPEMGVGILFCITFLFLGFILLGYQKVRLWFLFSLVLSAGAGVSLMGVDLIAASADGIIQPALQMISYALISLGVILFLVVYFFEKPLKKWAGFLLFLGGITGIIQQFLLLSVQSQTIKYELRNIQPPFFTSVSGTDIEIASIPKYYAAKVFPVYMGHMGFFLIFIALILLGILLFLNISLEKLAIAYFVISGFAVLSDLMIGNYLAIQVLNLNAGIFKAFLFIYPVERMFMAFFATIFGVGVIIPLKKFGLNNMFRR
jgi:hypothetical protein